LSSFAAGGGSAFVFALAVVVAFAFLVVIPEGDAVAFASVHAVYPFRGHPAEIRHYRRDSPQQEIVISTEAVHSLIVNSAVEIPAFAVVCS
jgi:hypothetical protein